MFKGNWSGHKDIHNQALIDSIRRQLAPNLNFHIIWSAHGGGLFQVSKPADANRLWSPSILYTKAPSAKFKSIYAIQVDSHFPLLLTRQLEGQLTQWLSAEKVISAFRRWADAEVSPEMYRELWAEVIGSVVSKILVGFPSQFAEFLAEICDTGKIYGPVLDAAQSRKYLRINVFQRFRDDIHDTRSWGKLSRTEKLYVLTVLGTEFSRRWSGWDRVKGK